MYVFRNNKKDKNVTPVSFVPGSVMPFLRELSQYNSIARVWGVLQAICISYMSVAVL